MAVLTDYIKWRGDLEFWQDGFNDFDNMVFSAISYVPIDKIFEHSDCKVLSLKYISDAYFAPDSDAEKFSDKSFLKETPNLLLLAAGSRRFENVLVRNYVNRIDTEKTLQFSAMEFLLPDGTSYVAYRGTDDTIVGWKEDFMMAVTEVEAEKEAVAYLNLIAKDSKRLLRLGGHSKGGHLAVYAGAFCEDGIKERILNIYSNDGPGFSREFVRDKRTKAIISKVTRILPEESMVGILMEPVGKTIVVKSVNHLVLAHDILSWCLDGMEFDTVPKITKASAVMDKAVDEWIDGFEYDARKGFVDELFSVLEASGAETLSELQEGGVKSLQLMTKRMNELSSYTKDKVNQILKALFLGMIKPEGNSKVK